MVHLDGRLAWMAWSSLARDKEIANVNVYPVFAQRLSTYLCLRTLLRAWAQGRGCLHVQHLLVMGQDLVGWTIVWHAGQVQLQLFQSGSRCNEQWSALITILRRCHQDT